MKRFFGSRRRIRGKHRGRGTAIVEFAVVLPLLLTILFGIIEFGYVFMIRQSLQHAAREGCRLAVLQTSVAPYTNVTQRVNDAMDPTGLSTYAVAMTHASAGNPVESVDVTVDYADVSLTGGFFGFANYTLRGSCSMRKEGAPGA